jgi:hypothetical protein
MVWKKKAKACICPKMAYNPPVFYKKDPGRGLKNDCFMITKQRFSRESRSFVSPLSKTIRKAFPKQAFGEA